MKTQNLNVIYSKKIKIIILGILFPKLFKKRGDSVKNFLKICQNFNVNNNIAKTKGGPFRPIKISKVPFCSINMTESDQISGF